MRGSACPSCGHSDSVPFFLPACACCGKPCGEWTCLACFTEFRQPVYARDRAWARIMSLFRGVRA